MELYHPNTFCPYGHSTRINRLFPHLNTEDQQLWPSSSLVFLETTFFLLLLLLSKPSQF
jgi:hypothetical protein